MYGINLSINKEGMVSLNEKLKYGRIDKGKSLLDYSIDDYTIIDIETTGLDPEFNEIIELGAIKVKNNKIVDTFSSLVKPINEIDDFIQKLTGITNEMVKNKPQLSNILDKYIDFIGNDIIVGHNVNFDINFIYDYSTMLYNKTISNDYVDTLRLSRYCVKDINSYSLENLSNHFNIDNNNEHRAIKDCEITFNLFNILKNIILINNIKINTKNTLALSKNIHITTDEIDSSNPFFNMECVFTGTLEKYSRKEAMQIIANLGGINSDSVRKSTNYLILGIDDYTKIKDGKSNKRKNAEKYILQGYDLKIISEINFLDMIKDYIK